MTKTETVQVLAEVAAIWPNFNRDRNPEVTLNVWHRLFGDYTYEQVSAALVAFVRSGRSNGFAPDPGQLVNIINSANIPDAPSETEAWAMVAKALHNGIYGYRSEFAKLPPLVQEVVGAPEMLREWAVMDESEVHTVVASNFQRSYRARAAKLMERVRIPDSVHDALRGPGLMKIGEVMAAIMPPEPQPAEEQPEKPDEGPILSFEQWAQDHQEDAMKIRNFLGFTPGHGGWEGQQRDA